MQRFGFGLVHFQAPARLFLSPQDKQGRSRDGRGPGTCDSTLSSRVASSQSLCGSLGNIVFKFYSSSRICSYIVPSDPNRTEFPLCAFG